MESVRTQLDDIAVLNRTLTELVSVNLACLGAMVIRPDRLEVETLCRKPKAPDTRKQLDGPHWARSKFPNQSALQLCQAFQFTLPNRDYPPAPRGQMSFDPAVAATVCPELCLPELPICLRRRGLWTTSVAMPETPMHENDSALPGKHDVWPTRQRRGVQSVSKAQRVE